MELDIFHLALKLHVRWEVAVGAATPYWTKCPDVESQFGGGGEDFPRTSSPALRPALPPVQRESPLLPEGKAGGAWR